MGLKDELADIGKKLEELGAAAAKLKNKNFADIVTSAKGRVQQLSEHPDLELAEKEMSGGEPLPFDPNAGQKSADSTEVKPVIVPPKTEVYGSNAPK